MSLGDIQLGHPGDYRDNVLSQIMPPKCHGQQVYMVCMPGESAHPVLAICPLPEPSAEATGQSGGRPLVGQDNPDKASIAGKSQLLQAVGAEHHGPSPRVPEGTMVSDAEDQSKSGFLLQWEQPDARDLRSSALGRDEEVDTGDPGGVSKASRAGGEGRRGEGTAADAGVENEGVRPSNGGVIGDGSRQSSPNEVICSTMISVLHKPGWRSSPSILAPQTQSHIYEHSKRPL